MSGYRGQLRPHLVFPWSAYVEQSRAADRWAQEEAELDAREDECLRMFGVEVTYLMDERVIRHGS